MYVCVYVCMCVCAYVRSFVEVCTVVHLECMITGVKADATQMFDLS